LIPVGTNQQKEETIDCFPPLPAMSAEAWATTIADWPHFHLQKN
jgi:hypothetical protein